MKCARESQQASSDHCEVDLQLFLLLLHAEAFEPALAVSMILREDLCQSLAARRPVVDFVVLAPRLVQELAVSIVRRTFVLKQIGRSESLELSGVQVLLDFGVQQMWAVHHQH